MDVYVYVVMICEIVIGMVLFSDWVRNVVFAYIVFDASYNE